MSIFPSIFLLKPSQTAQHLIIFPKQPYFYLLSPANDIVILKNV
jgi:hypothetical protein